jgi:acetyl-CoA carboxylase carboxyltransferase component
MALDASVNAVYAGKIDQISDPAERAEFIARRQAEHRSDINLLRMGSDLVIDAVVAPELLRADLAARLAAADGWSRGPQTRHRINSPV